MSEIILQGNNLTKTFPAAVGATEEITIFSDLNIALQQGEIIAIVGASGSGKSTLLHILGGLDAPTSGSVKVASDNAILELHALSSAKLASVRNQVFGFIFQFHHLLPEFTALENVTLPALIGGISQREANSRAAELLSLVGLDQRQTHKPAQLSGGEQQRVAFARALINNPSVILADEPTGNLDALNANSVIALMQSIRDKYNQSFIIVTHSSDVAKAADRVLTLHQGVLT